ncbi:peptidoglycan recognition protein family protein [Devosia aquimaris]|uniref:hypothetical protein n=1 Tax=Devosia aquimaris TaxID=2866214 RepID=UPI001CD0DE65|nr:hypothetical protein [Devosia sp. CJK-A8-3]
MHVNATLASRDIGAAEVRAMQKSQGWSDVGYNALSVSISISELTYHATQQEKRTNTLVEMTGPIVPLTPVNKGAPA